MRIEIAQTDVEFKMKTLSIFIALVVDISAADNNFLTGTILQECEGVNQNNFPTVIVRSK